MSVLTEQQKRAKADRERAKYHSDPVYREEKRAKVKARQRGEPTPVDPAWQQSGRIKMECQVCGEPIVRTSASQKYCQPCGEKTAKAAARENARRRAAESAARLRADPERHAAHLSAQRERQRQRYRNDPVYRFMMQDPAGSRRRNRERRRAALLPLLEAQDWLCNGCGKTLDISPATHIDHIVPGQPAVQALCAYCNQLKSDRSMEWLLDELASHDHGDDMRATLPHHMAMKRDQ